MADFDPYHKWLGVPPKDGRSSIAAPRMLKLRVLRAGISLYTDLSLAQRGPWVLVQLRCGCGAKRPLTASNLP